MFKKSLAYYAPLLSTLFIPSAADAERYSFPGANCVTSSNSMVYPADGKARPTTTPANIFCPILRRSPTTTSITNISVTVEDSNNGDVSCYVQSCNANMLSCLNSATVSSGTAFQGFVTMPLGSVGAFTDGGAVLRCTATLGSGPGHSAILSYRWDD